MNMTRHVWNIFCQAYIELSEKLMVKVDGDGEDDVDNDELSPIELSERSKLVVSGAKKWGTCARLAEVQETLWVDWEQEHLGFWINCRPPDRDTRRHSFRYHHHHHHHHHHHQCTLSTSCVEIPCRTHARPLPRQEKEEEEEEELSSWQLSHRPPLGHWWRGHWRIWRLWQLWLGEQQLGGLTWQLGLGHPRWHQARDPLGAWGLCTPLCPGHFLEPCHY